MTSLTYQNQTASKSLFQAGFAGRPNKGHFSTRLRGAKNRGLDLPHDP